MSDELRAIAARDRDAFARWLAGRELRLRASLRSFATRVDVEAVVQETLLRVWQVAPRVVPDGDSDPLFRLALRIARNLAIDAARRADRAYEPDPEAQTSVAPASADPWLRERIARCFAQLPDKPKRAMLARIADQRGRDDRSVASSLRMRTNTFLQNVGRARRLLAACLERLGVDLTVERA